MTRFRMMLVLLGWFWADVAGADDASKAASAPRIQIEAVIYEVDPAKLAKLADKTKSPVAELLKLNGFHQVAAVGGRPVFVLATRKEPLAFDIHGQETVGAFKRFKTSTVTVLSGRKGTVHFGGQFPILFPIGSQSDRDTVIEWHDFGTTLTLIPIVEPDGRIKLEFQIEDSRLDDTTAVTLNGVEVEVPGLTIKYAASVQAEFQLPGHLLIADGTSESDLTRIVQLTPRVMTDGAARGAQPVSESEQIQQRPTPPAVLVAETSKPADDANGLVEQPRRLAPLNPDPSKPADKRQILLDVKVWEINQDVLRGLAKSEFAVHEFFKANGLIKQPDWIAAAIGHAISELLAPPGGQLAAPAPLPLRAFAVTKRPVSMKLLGNDISSAFHTLAEPELVATVGREATLISGGEAPIFVPRADDPKCVAGWQEFGVMMKFVPHLLDNGQIVLALDFENSERIAPSNAHGDSSASLIDSQGFRLSVQMKLGERLIVAQQTVKQSVIRLVQIQPMPPAGQFDTEPAVDAPAARGRVYEFQNSPPSSHPLLQSSSANSEIRTPDPGGSLPRVTPAAATSSRKNGQLRELLHEIRELRQELRTLKERLEREEAATIPGPAASLDQLPKTASDRSNAASEFDKLIEQFNHLMDQQRFAEAEVIAKQAKELDATNPVSETMRWKAIYARRFDDEKRRTATGSSHFQDAESTLVCPSPIEHITVGVRESNRAAAAKLDMVVKLDASDLPLRKVIEQLAANADINIVLDKAGLEEVGITAETPVTRTLNGVTLRSALKIVLDPLKLSHVIDGEVLKITSPQRATGPDIVVVYPVADLVTGEHSQRDSLHELLELIWCNVGPESQWVNPPRSQCVDATNTIVIRQPEAVHDQVRTFLGLLRAAAQAARSGKATAGQPVPTPEEQRIARQLGKTVSVDIAQHTPLREALKQFVELADFNIVLDAAGLEDESLNPTTPVTLQVRDVRLSTALRLLLEPLNLAAVVKNEVLLITSRARAAGEMTVATYPVADLVLRDQENFAQLSDLYDLLMIMIEPHSWDIAGAPGRVRANHVTQSLVIRQTPANHAKIRELLETLRKAGGRTAASMQQASGTEALPVKHDVKLKPVTMTQQRDQHSDFKQVLRTQVSVHFDHVSLSDAIERLARDAKIGIRLDQAGLEDESLTADTPVSLNVDGIQLRNALILLLDPLNLAYVVEADGLKVTSLQRIQGELIPVTYSVAELVAPVATVDVKQPVDDKDHRPRFEEIVELITSSVAPNSWSEVGGTGQLKTNSDTLSLLIRQTQAAHDEIRDLLEQLLRLHGRQVDVSSGIPQ